MKTKLSSQPGTTSQVKTGHWREWHYPEIDKEKCIGCAQCDLICPEGVCFSAGVKNQAGKIFFEKDLQWCKGCGLCAEICPVKAIVMREEIK